MAAPSSHSQGATAPPALHLALTALLSALCACPPPGSAARDAAIALEEDGATLADAAGEDAAAPQDAGREAGVDAGGCAAADPLEPNDHPDAASLVAVPSSHPDLALCGGADWYALRAPAGQDLTIEIVFDAARADLDLALFAASDPSTPVAASTGYGGREQIARAATADETALLVRVLAYGDAGATAPRYDLTLTAAPPPACADDDGEPNDHAAEASALSGWVLDRVLCPGNADLYRFQLARPGPASRVVVLAAAPLDLEVRSEGSSTPLGAAAHDAAGGATTVTFDSAADTSYLVELRAPVDAEPQPYALFTYGARPGNDTCAGATPLAPGSEVLGSTIDADDDLRFASGFASCTGWAERGGDVVYRVSLPAAATAVATLHATADLALYLLQDCVERCCWAGADRGAGGEALGYTNASGAAQDLYLVVDSFDRTVAGDFSLRLALDPPDAGVDAGAPLTCQHDVRDAGAADVETEG